MKTSSGFTLYSEDRMTETYSTAGRALTVADPQGIAWTFTYSGTYLDRVTHTSGRYVQFTWSSGQLTQVRDPAGNLFAYAYDANEFGSGLHRLKSATQPATPPIVTNYLYALTSDASALTSIMVGSSTQLVRALFTYDSSKRGASSQLAGGGPYSFSYANGSGGALTTTVTNPLGKKTSYIFANGKLTTVTGSPSTYCPLTTNVLTEYDANGYPAMTSDANGNDTAYVYNDKGQMTSMIEAYGTSLARTTQYVWDAATNLLKSVTVVGVRKLEYAYTADKRIASIKETNLLAPSPANDLNQARTTTFAYTEYANGMLHTMAIDGPLSGTGDATTTTYDALGNTVSIANGLGQASSYSTFTGLGQAGKVAGPNGDIVETTYDARGRATAIKTHLNGGLQTYSLVYTSFGKLDHVTFPDERVRTYYYVIATSDLVKSVQETRGPAKWDVVDYVRDGAGNIVETQTGAMHTVLGGGGAVTTEMKTDAFTDYDELNRPRARRGNNGQNVRYTYDANGNLKTITDSYNKVTTLTYDALNRVATSKDAKGGITKFAYDAGDHLVKVTDPRNLATSYVYDGFGQLWKQASPDSGTTTFAYDAYGRETSMTRASGAATTYGYDATGRLTTVTAGSATQTFTYDCATGNSKGRLCKAADPSGSVTYAYTPDGQLTSQASTMPASGAGTMTYTYDDLGRIATIAYPGGQVATYGYASGNAVSLSIKVGTATTSLVAAAAYQPFGPALGWDYGNGLHRGFDYDLDGRVTGISTGVTGSSVLQSLTYAYDNNDVIKTITNGVSANLTQNYAYDELSRLTAVTAASANQSFAYDANGNRTQHVHGGTDAYTIAAASNKLTGISGTASKTFTFDANGNVATGAGATYTYDAFNRMSQAVKGGTTTAYAVNALGQRVYKKVGSVKTWFVYGAGNQLLAEYKDGQQWTDYVYFAGEPVAMVRGGAISYIHPDHLGRPEIVTNAAKAVVWRASNSAFDRGVTLDGIGGLNLGFPGQYYDAETGNWNNGFRDYDGSIGRYLQSDPMGLQAGINTYSYVKNGPVIGVDPFGLSCSCDKTGQVSRANNPHVTRNILLGAAAVGTIAVLIVGFPETDVAAGAAAAEAGGAGVGSAAASAGMGEVFEVLAMEPGVSRAFFAISNFSMGATPGGVMGYLITVQTDPNGDTGCE